MKIGRIIFNILSILFICSLIGIYSYRLIHFYKLEHMVYENSESKLYEVLINNKGIEGTDEGLQTSDDGYIYGSKSENNYAYYAGRMWRIISIDKENRVKMITDEAQTLLAWDKEEFEASDINKWLNKNEDDANSGIFEKSLKTDTKASLLSISEYKRLKENNYLISETPYWIIDEDNKAMYVDAKGEINKDNKSSFFGVRPTIVIPNDVIYTRGTGASDNPYIFTNDNVTTLKDAYVGEYVSFNDSNWRIIEVDDTKVKVALDDVITYDKNFGSTNIYNASNGVGQYLNTTYYNEIENKDYILDGTYYTGNYNNGYESTYTSNVTLKIGIYRMGEFFINELPSVYTMTPYARTKNTIYTINNNKKVYADYITKKNNLRPTLYLDGTLNILEGKGTKDFAYKVGK